MSLLNAESQHKKIDVPIYGSQFVVCKGTEKENRSFLKKELGFKPKETLLPDDYLGRLLPLRCSVTGRPIWVLLFPSGKDSELEAHTVVHELYHLTREILEYHGVEDEEAGAYLIGWLSESFL